MKVSCIVFIVGVASCIAGTPWHDLSEKYSFAQYCAEFGKYYEGSERSAREGVFQSKLEKILAHNRDPTQTWKRGVNQFTDLIEEELRGYRGADKMRLFTERQEGSLNVAKTAPTKLPDRIDYREARPAVVTPVKNQGGCGSCWAFASTETVESHWAIKTGRLQDLAPQFILDCTPNNDSCGGTGGCNGGTAALAFDRLKALGGMPSEWEYPYISGTGKPGTCHGLPLLPEHPHSGAVMKAANVTGRVAVPSNDYNAVMAAIASVGPLTITVDAGAWHDYETGVFDGGNATNPDLDHLVQMVGYGTDKESGKDYFLVRNSWTPEWGEDGYIRLFRSSNPVCGVDVTPSDGDGCAGGPPSVKVCGTSGVLYDAAYPIVV